jgi:hypothetical protein
MTDSLGVALIHGLDRAAQQEVSGEDQLPPGGDGTEPDEAD